MFLRTFYRTPTAPSPSAAHTRAPLVAALLLGAFVGGCAAWGHWLEWRGAHLHLASGQPLTGGWDPRLPVLALVPVVLGVASVRWGPCWAERLPWRRLLVGAGLAAAAWAVALAIVDGPEALAEPLTTRWEYLVNVDRVGALRPFLATFTDHVLYVPGEFQWATHVSGHPPGALLAFVGLDRLGLGAPGWAAALCIAAGASAVPAALSTVRLLGGEPVARRAAPFVAVAPAAVWVATSADALFLGVSAWGVCALAHAAARRDRRGDALALAGGLLMGATLFLSYGLALTGLLVVAVVVGQRRLRPLLVGAVGVGVVVGGFAALGFWWLDGLDFAAARVKEGPAWIERPWFYFAVANLAALGVAVGPATVAALTRVIGRDGNGGRDDTGGPLGRAVMLPAAALTAVALAIGSNLSKGEVERIYLPFAIWLLPLAAALPGGYRRGWLAAQVGVALAVQLLMRTSW